MRNVEPVGRLSPPLEPGRRPARACSCPFNVDPMNDRFRREPTFPPLHRNGSSWSGADTFVMWSGMAAISSQSSGTRHSATGPIAIKFHVHGRNRLLLAAPVAMTTMRWNAARRWLGATIIGTSFASASRTAFHLILLASVAVTRPKPFRP